jgi:hypothetical protein
MNVDLLSIFPDLGDRHPDTDTANRIRSDQEAWRGLPRILASSGERLHF